MTIFFYLMTHNFILIKIDSFDEYYFKENNRYKENKKNFGCQPAAKTGSVSELDRSG